MHAPVCVEPHQVYDDGAIYMTFGISSNALATARHSGALRFTRRGQRTLYLGQWVLDWLKAGGQREADHAR